MTTGMLAWACFLAMVMPAPLQSQTAAVNDTVLLVIDIQNFYFEGGKLALSGPVEASLQAKALLERFRTARRPVFHVQHLPAGKESYQPGKDDPQYAIHPNVAPLPGETVVIKHEANSFRGTVLLDELKRANIKKLVICGMQTHMCVEAAVRAAADFGFEVLLAGDACATRPLSFDGRQVPADTVQATTLAVLNGAYAKVMSTAELLAILK
jgi:nicotinamidase-related amidase